MNTDELRRALHRDVELAPLPPRDLLDQVAQRRRRSNRRRAAGIAGGLVLAGAIAGLPAIVDAVTGPDGTSVAQAPTVDIMAAPTRGSLAGDEQLLAAIEQLDWSGAANPAEAGPQPGAADRTVVFAGDVGDSRLALVAAPVSGTTSVIWFSGPAGAPADQLQPLTASKPVTPDLPLAAIDLSTPNPVAVVVSAPGDDIEFSPAVQLSGDGTLTRRYEAGAEVADGVASWPTSSAGAQALTFRVARSDIVDLQAPFDIGGGADDPADPVVPGYADPRGYAAAADDRFIATMVDEVTSKLHLTADQLAPTLLWAGEVPGPDTTTNTAVVLGYTAPNGATLVQETAFVEDSTGGYQIVPGTVQPFPAGTAVEDHALLIRNTLGDGSGNGESVTSLLAIGPAAATQARLTLADGTAVTPAPLTGGVTTLGDQDAVTVDFLEEAGTVLATASLSPAFTYGVGGSWPQ
jgi:hypothetical protein